MKIDPGPAPLLEGDKQITIGDLDLVLTSDGLTLKGYLYLTGGTGDAETARELSDLLARAAAELAAREKAPQSELPSNPDFGAAFD